MPVGSKATVNSKYTISDCAEVAAKLGISELMLPLSAEHKTELVIYLPKPNHVAVFRHKSRSIFCPASPE